MMENSKFQSLYGVENVEEFNKKYGTNFKESDFDPIVLDEDEVNTNGGIFQGYFFYYYREEKKELFATYCMCSSDTPAEALCPGGDGKLKCEIRISNVNKDEIEDALDICRGLYDDYGFINADYPTLKKLNKTN